jgi:hypothetical protein
MKYPDLPGAVNIEQFLSDLKLQDAVYITHTFTDRLSSDSNYYIQAFIQIRPSAYRDKGAYAEITMGVIKLAGRADCELEVSLPEFYHILSLLKYSAKPKYVISDSPVREIDVFLDSLTIFYESDSNDEFRELGTGERDPYVVSEEAIVFILEKSLDTRQSQSINEIKFIPPALRD